MKMGINTIIKQIKGVFILPKKHYYIGTLSYGTPYFYPWNFNRQILTIRKTRPFYLRCKYFKLFGYEISYGWPFAIVNYGLGWKMKYDSPRFEWQPSFQIYFFNWQFAIHWNAPLLEGELYSNNDKYYEQILWFLHNNKDIIKTEQTWGWTDWETGKSTWNNKYLI